MVTLKIATDAKIPHGPSGKMAKHKCCPTCDILTTFIFTNIWYKVVLKKGKYFMGWNLVKFGQFMEGQLMKDFVKGYCLRVNCKYHDK